MRSEARDVHRKLKKSHFHFSLNFCCLCVLNMLFNNPSNDPHIFAHKMTLHKLQTSQMKQRTKKSLFTHAPKLDALAPRKALNKM
jgi:hypothetical protein